MRNTTITGHDAYDEGFQAGSVNGEFPPDVARSFMYYDEMRAGWLDGRTSYFKNSHAHLGGLVNYLLRNYPDDQWDDSTKEMFEAANAHLGNQPIEWMVDGPEEH